MALGGWEALADVHPRLGGSEGGNKSQSSQTLAACTLGCKQELPMPTALPSIFIIACAYEHTNASKPAQVLQKWA